MINYYKIIFLCILTVACSTALQTKYGIDDEFRPYYNSFIANLDHPVYGLSINFDSLDSGIVGQCNPLLYDIRIDKRYWSVSDEWARTVVIWHEMAHCLLGREHVNNLLFDDCPMSIMYPTVDYLTEYCHNRRPGYYEQELFLR